MPSIVPGFEYDIFISYRQNDNRSGWVTEFVKHLNEELAAAFKEPVSVYFDSNPHDGLLETHDVDDSLKGKLKCLVFIPILSQTYCDPKSFAWKGEFVPFKALASSDALGLKIKLANGNVASRILPICITELDPADKQVVEEELGGVLRSIDFIYRTPGVVRPLKPMEEEAKANLNHTFYSDQINKTARAIKELITGAQNPNASVAPVKGGQESVSPREARRASVAAALVVVLGIVGYSLFYFTDLKSKIFAERDRSIAVLPFENMNKDSTQDYFSNGIAEDILNHLVKISDLQVKSRTSTLQYKGTTKTAPVIGDELQVSNIVEGSVRRVGNKVRIVVQLIDAKSDTHLWSETYDRDFEDVLALQSEIAIEIARALESRLTAAEKKEIQKEVTTDVSAYDFYLQARDMMDNENFSRATYEKALTLVNSAIELDHSFSNAYAMKGEIWYQLSLFGLPQTTWEDSARLNINKSIAIDSLNASGYEVLARMERFLGNMAEARQALETAYRLNPKDLRVQNAYGYQLIRDHNEHGADMVIRSIERNYSTKQSEYYQSFVWPLMWMGDIDAAEANLRKVISLSPEADYYYYPLAIAQQIKGDYRGSIKTSEVIHKRKPLDSGPIDNLAWSYFKLGEYEQAASYWGMYKEVEAEFEDDQQIVPFRHRLAMTYQKLGKSKQATELLMEDLEIQKQLLNRSRGTGAWTSRGGNFYDLAVDLALLGRTDEAIQSLDSAVAYEYTVPMLFKNDEAFEKIKSTQGFMKVQAKVDDEQAFFKLAFTNAFNRAQASKEMKGLRDK